MAVPQEKIGNLCDLINGRAFKSTEWREAGLPIIRIQNLTDESKPFNYFDGEYLEKHEVNTGDLLFSWSGTPGTSFGAFFWERGKGVLNQHIFNVRSDTNRVDPKYFRYAINNRLTLIIDQAHGGVGLKHITKGKFEAVQIPLPPLAEQKRIAEVLDRAEALRARRRAALALLDELTQSIFLDMFGDPRKNPKNWNRIRFNDLLENIDSGWSPSCLDRPVEDGEWGVLKLGAVTYCKYNAAENKALPTKLEPRPELEVKAGDVLFSRKNTYNLVAACAFVQETPPRLMLPDLVFRFRLNEDAALDPVFLQALLVYPTKRRNIQRLAGGSSGSMPNISKARLKSVMIEVPPFKLQQRYREIVSAIQEQRVRHEAALNALDELFASLQSRAFKGELFGRSREPVAVDAG